MINISKFKNAIPRFPKKENIISELPIKSQDITNGNAIVCNTESIFFALGSGDVGLVPLTDAGKKGFSTPRLSASSNSIVSIACTYLDSSLLATACEAEGLKLWNGNHNSDNSPYTTFSKIECRNNERIRDISFHPCTSEIVSYVSNKGLSVVNVQRTDQSLCALDSSNLTSFSWKDDGSTVVTFDEAGEFKLFDPRSSQTYQKLSSSLKNTKVIWAGTTPYFMAFASEKSTTSRYSYAWDSRKLDECWSKKLLDTSTGYLLPVYDPDTNIIVVGTKGGNVFHFMELESSGFSPVRVDRTDEPSFGVCTIPRTCLNVMSCEVMRIIQLNKSSISPIPYIVTRKSYTSYYPELFPDACENVSSLSGSDWFSGKNVELKRISLEPKIEISPESSKCPVLSSEQNNLPSPSSYIHKIPSFLTDTELYSKFRNIKGFRLHKDLQHEMLNNIDKKSSAESNGLSVYLDNMAIPLVGTTGKIGILKLSKPGRVPDCGPFYIENKSPLCDFDIDKKNENLLAAICEDCAINIWKLPPRGLESNLMKSDDRITGNTERSSVLKFHPCADGILSTASFDGSIKIWDIVKREQIISLKTQDKSQLLYTNWNESGSMICSVSIDKKVNIFDPRSSISPVSSAKGFHGSCQGRILFLDDNLIFLSGFTNRGNRNVGVMDMRSSGNFLCKVEMDIAPSVLIPSYDIDNKMIYLTGKGDCSIFPFELRPDSFTLFECQKYQTVEPHSGVCMLRKDRCNVREVEVAKFVRLMKTNTEIVSFVVPRLKSEYFQDDLYPHTRKVWDASMSSNEWIQNKNTVQGTYDLKPQDMIRLSEANIQNTQTKKYDSIMELERSKKKEIAKTDSDFLEMVMGKAKLREDDPIVQDEKQGVSESEWD